MATKTGRKLLVCSIGNPTSAYRNTRHSAGHAVLELIRETLEYPAFEHSHQFGGRVSRGLYDGYTLFESSSYMNLSGKPVASAWKTFQRELDEEDKKRAMLVVLHDNLDKPMGVVKVKKTGSANGHNGITSIINSLGTKEFVRLAIGIGRPTSKESSVISEYVLGKFTSHERGVLEAQSLGKVLGELHKLAKSN